jgi:hypothetical protein
MSAGLNAPALRSSTTSSGFDIALIVQLSSERELEPMRRDCSSAEKQEPQLALLFVVRCERVGSLDRHARFTRASRTAKSVA